MQTERDRKRLKFRNMLLRLSADAGGIAVVMVAPKMTKLLGKLDRPARNRATLYNRIEQGIYKLRKAGLVTVTGVRRERRIELTKKGEKLLEEIEFGDYEVPAQAFWDGKWRVLLFDIPERRRRVRDQLRRLLSGAGFVKLQDSAWVSPYPCDEFVSLLRAHLKSGVGEMRSLVAEALESDKALREHFGLSNRS